MRVVIVYLLSLIALVALAHAEDTVVQTKVNSVGLFKNGLCVIERSLDLPGPGSYRIEDVPTPVHGTFFVESASPVTVRVTEMLVDAPLDLASQPLQDQLAGRTVELTIKDQPAPIAGKVAVLPPPEKNWSRQFQQPQFYYDGWGRMVQQNANRFIVLETKDGSTLVDQAQITSVRITGEAKTAKKRKPVLILSLPEGAPKQKVAISYLSTGLAWAPSYRVDLLDDKSLMIAQNAVVKNELMDLKDVEVSLISGYPSIDFGHVTSPLALQQSWAAFFQQLSTRPRPGYDNNAITQQRAVMMNARSPDAEGGGLAAPPDESIDVHYESIGKQALGEGDALAVGVGEGKADYDRVVEWLIPDSRQANGRFYDEYARRNEPDRFDDSPWDAVKFKNPLAFAMTTAPATFMKDGKFMGQQISRWVNRGEETTLRITKALSIRTRATESEDANADRNKLVYIGGNDFRQVSAKGELTIRNYRKTDATVVIKRQFSGDITSADEKPEITLREEGIWSVNKRNEAKWTITLKAGEEKTLKYAYTVLVDN